MITKQRIVTLILALSALTTFFAYSDERPAWTRSLAHYLPKLPSGADGAFTHTTKGGVRYVAYSPLDEFGTPMSEQFYLWWVTEPWDGDDEAYAQARQLIDAAVKKGTKPIGLVARYKKELQSDPWNPLKVYRWAYASWLARKAAETGTESRTIFRPVGDYMPEVRFPRSYQYARMAFLAQASNRPEFALKHVGEQLLQRNPNDEDVKFYMIRVLQVGRNTRGSIARIYDPRDDAQALSYINSFRKKYPRKPIYDVEYARVMEYFWDRSRPRSQQKAQAAIAAYQAFLRKYPGTPFRTWALAQIKEINLRQQDWETWERKNWEKEQARLRAKQSRGAHR